MCTETALERDYFMTGERFPRLAGLYKVVDTPFGSPGSTVLRYYRQHTREASQVRERFVLIMMLEPASRIESDTVQTTANIRISMSHIRSGCNDAGWQYLEMIAFSQYQAGNEVHSRSSVIGQPFSRHCESVSLELTNWTADVYLSLPGSLALPIAIQNNLDNMIECTRYVPQLVRIGEGVVESQVSVRMHDTTEKRRIRCDI